MSFFDNPFDNLEPHNPENFNTFLTYLSGRKGYKIVAKLEVSNQKFVLGNFKPDIDKDLAKIGVENIGLKEISLENPEQLRKILGICLDPKSESKPKMQIQEVCISEKNMYEISITPENVKVRACNKKLSDELANLFKGIACVLVLNLDKNSY